MVTPCVIINAFQVKYTESIRNGLILAFAAAIFIHIALLILVKVFEKILYLDAIEKTSIIYSNAANLSFKKIFDYKRIYIIAFLKMIVCPIIILIPLKYFGMMNCLAIPDIRHNYLNMEQMKKD